MSNYQKVHVGADARTELHDALGLSGAEVSVNHLPAGGSVPFVHSHRQNEEIYGILSGRGALEIDGETVTLNAGDWLRISPAGKRRLRAAEDSELSYICVQVKENSLEAYTGGDAEICG